ncbi:MAG TPA: carboxypeptidase regulatory-like domain-containing protein [Thermoanaerobaculia bacterium]|nr:carboxypeptidase regulatory-like domain-containing protein [Thermoanaerobaculia bacterium]
MKRLIALLLLAPCAFALDIEGYVFAPDGTLVPDAKVSVYAPEQRVVLKSATATDGHFKLTGLPDSLFDVEVTSPKFGEATMTAVPNDPPLTITLTDAGGASARPVPPERRAEARPASGDRTIGGIIRLNKKPLAGVRVMLQPMGEGMPRTVVTDAEGRYRATKLAPGRYVLGVAPGLEARLRAPWTSHMFDERRAPNIVNVTDDQAATLDVDVTLVPLVTGRVVDHEKKPVSGAEVRVFIENASSAHVFDDTPWVARTLPDGRYAVPVPPFEPEQRVQVLVARSRHAVARSKPFVLGTGPHQVDVTLPRFESVVVRVLGADGSPLPKARVTYEETSHIETTRMSPLLTQRALVTNDAGEVALQLLPGEYDFAASAKAHRTRKITARRIARATTVDIALEPAFTIRGRVHRRGTGVEGVHVTVFGNERETRGLQTGADGSFELTGLARDTYRIAFMKPDELIDRVVEAAAPSTLDVELPPAGVIRGRAVDEVTRAAVTEFMYAIEALDMPAESTTSTRGNMRRTEHRAEGAFTARLPVGRYRLTVMAQGYRASDPVEVRVTEEKPVDVEVALDRGATLSGRVTDDTGAPVREASVWITVAGYDPTRSSMPPRGAPVSGRTDAGGAFSLTGIEPGRVTLVVQKEGFVPARKAIDADGATRADVTLSRGLTLTGVVLQGGRPAADVQVSASTAAVEGEHQSAITDANGRFTLSGLIPARYTVTAFREGGAGHAEVPNVDVTRQREVTINLDAKRRATIYGTVTGIPAYARGKMTDRSVMAQGGEHGAQAMVDESGSYRIEDAPAGTVTVMAHLQWPGGNRTSSVRQVQIAPGESMRVDLDLSSDVTVRGRVLHEGKPIPGARVVFSLPPHLMAGGTTREDGTYEATLPEPGTYRVFVHGERLAATNFSMVREIRGGETIDIDLRDQTIEGIVLDADTRQPITAFVNLDVSATATPEPYVSGSAMTDPNGRFRITTSAMGPHRLTVFAPGYAHHTQPIALGGAPAAPLTFELRRVEELRVRVTDARTGAALGAHIIVADERGQTLPVHPMQGRGDPVTRLSLAPGRYRITAVVQGYSARTVTATAPGTIDVVME